MSALQSLREYEQFVYSLAAPHPHHKHIPPELKHHRVPAPSLSFSVPNLPFLVQDAASS
jgi:hypothetical protein